MEKHSQATLSVKVALDVRDWLRASAASGYRSMNAQVVLILDAARAEEQGQQKLARKND